MIRRAAIIAALWSPAALAQPAGCLDTSADWSVPYSQGTIQITSYFVGQRLFSVIFRSGEAHFHINVPVSVAQPFSRLTTADQRYNGFVKNTYKQAILTEGGCPLRAEDGNFLLGQQP